MTPEKKEQIEALAAIATEKRDRFMALGMLNIYGRLTEERVQMARDYAVAEAEMMEADANLRLAQQP